VRDRLGRGHEGGEEAHGTSLGPGPGGLTAARRLDG